MPHPSHRLDLWFVCATAPPPLAQEALDSLVGPRGEALVPGGAQAVLVHRWDHVRLVVNQQGGFRVACPTCKANVLSAFSRALGDWRRGGPRALTCPACGAAADLDALAYAPPAAFGGGGLQLVDVQNAEPDGEALGRLGAWLGPFRVVPRRVG